MSPLLQKIMIALGRSGIQTPVDETLGNAYRSLQQGYALYPGVFHEAAEILVSEIEGGATNVAGVPARIAHLCQMLDRLHREEDLEGWSETVSLVAA